MDRLRVVVVATALLAMMVPAVSAVGQPTNYGAHLSGDQEVPEVDTGARGQARLQLDRNGTALQFRLVAANIHDVIQAHIHCGAAGANGPVVAFLYPDGPPPVLIPGRFSGVLATGLITPSDVIARPDSPACPGGVADFADLVDRIDTGLAYVNVHTSDHPAGEIRGQIR